MSTPYKPMGGRPDRMKLNCENPVQQSIGGKRGMKAKLDANQIEALWDEVQANRRLGWKAPTAK